MDHNPVKTLPPRAFHLTGLINVQKVFLKNCSLNDLDPTALAGLVILIELDLSENKIKELKQGTFQGNVRLRKLRMSSNQLDSLASFTFPSMGHLRLIDLGYNQLTRISTATFTNLGANLEVLHLNNNNFKRLGVRPFLSLHHLKSLRIEGNPWQCDCKLRDLWHWLQAKRLLLAFNAATCAGPAKLKGRGLHDLDSEEHLACAPLVTVPQYSVPVTKGGHALLPCRLEEGEAAEVTWLREGVAVKANLSHEAVIYGQYYVIYTGQRWYNLSIENIEPPTSSDLYTCIASNEGGTSLANVTLVHSPNVATYVGDGEAVISWLLTGGVASGVLIFLILSLWLLFCSVQRARRQHRGGLVNSTTGTKPSETITSSNGHLLANSVGEDSMASRTASIEAIEASTFEEQQLRQTTAVARAQRTKGQNVTLEVNSSSCSSTNIKDPLKSSMNNSVVTDDWDERPFPDLLDCHAAAQANSYITTAETSLNMSEQQAQTSLNMSGQVQQQPPPPPFTPQIQSSWPGRPLMSSNNLTAPAGGQRLFTPSPLTAGNYGTATSNNPPRGYMNSLSCNSQGSRPPPCGTAGGQLSDPDSGCFSSSGNETWFDQRGLMTMDSSPLSSSGSSMMSQMRVSSGAGDMGHCAQGPQVNGALLNPNQPQVNGALLNPYQQTQMSQQMMSQQQQHAQPSHNMVAGSTTNTNNARLLAHTLENRKRVLQTLIREKADTLV